MRGCARIEHCLPLFLLRGRDQLPKELSAGKEEEGTLFVFLERPVRLCKEREISIGNCGMNRGP